MAFALVASVVTAAGSSGGTSSAIDTTGANLITRVVSSFGAGFGSISDSKGNTYTSRTLSGGSGAPNCQIWDCLNPTVGASHTFTASTATMYPVDLAYAWSGANASASFDQENGATGSGTSLNTGSVTPSEDNELVIAGMCGGVSSPSEAISLLTLDHYQDHSGGNNMGGGFAHEIQTTATARNPAWSGASQARAVRIATYKAAAATKARPPFINRRWNFWKAKV